MEDKNDIGDRRELPPGWLGWPWWLPLGIFIIVLFYAAYLMKNGFEPGSAIIFIIAVAVAAGEVIRRLMSGPGR